MKNGGRSTKSIKFPQTLCPGDILHQPAHSRICGVFDGRSEVRIQCFFRENSAQMCRSISALQIRFWYNEYVTPALELNPFSSEDPKRVIDKQCRLRSDAAGRGI